MSQISHIKYKDVIEAWRFDAEYFKPKFLEMISNLEKKWCFVLWENAKIRWWKRLPLWENFSDDWIPYIRAEDIKNWFVDYENSPRISEDLHKILINYQTKKDDVLITIVWNSVWDVWFIKFDLDKCNLTENACKIIDLNWINADSFFAFMLSEYWQNQIHREKVWTAQPKLALERIRRFKIPNINENVQQKISEIIEIAYSKQKESKQLYQEAEDLLLAELWLKEHVFTHTLTFSTTKKWVNEAWRYDADYFQPKYDELIEKIENYKWGREYLKELTTYINNWNQPPYSENWDIKFFSQKWIKDKWIDYSFLESAEEPMVESSFFDEDKKKSSLVSKWDILYYSVWANLWYCHTYLADEKIAVWSFINIIRTDTSKFDSVAMWVILNSMIWRMQADRDKSWVAQPYIYAKNLRKFKIPLINSQLQKEISDKIKESFKLRNESKELLEQAKKMVEDEIEKE